MRRGPLLLLVLCVATAAVATITLTRRGEPSPPASVADRAAPAPLPALAAPAVAVNRESSPAAPGEGAASGPVEDDDPTLPATGLLELEAVDAQTGEATDGLKIHLFRAEGGGCTGRFAEARGDSSLRLALTSGRWEAELAANGHEPLRLDPFEIRAGQTTRLGSIALARGSAAIEGRVLARHLPADQAVHVELFGDGRGPCDACLARKAGKLDADEAAKSFGSDCGYRDDRDALDVAGERTFSFGNLAAGVYWLRACDPEQRIVESVRIEIGRGGRSWRELDVSAPTLARIELRQDGGAPFTGAWATVHHAWPAATRYRIRRRGADVGSAEIRTSADDARASVGPPIAIPGAPPEDLLGQDVAQLLSVSLRFQTATAPGRRVDRAFQAGDLLDFDTPEPPCDGVSLKVTALEPGLHQLEPLPRAELTVEVSCGDYRSDELPLDLRFDVFQPLVVTMHLRPEIAERMAEIRRGPPASCIACHGKDQPTDGGVVYPQAPAPEVSLDGSTILLDRLGFGSTEIPVLNNAQIRSGSAGIELSFSPNQGAVLQDGAVLVSPNAPEPPAEGGDPTDH